MKKKLLTLFLALVLMLVAFSLTAYAAVYEVNTIVIENLRAPLAGNMPDYDLDYTHSALVSKQTIDSPELVKDDTLVNGVAWYEVQANSKLRVMKKGEAFELGKKYCAKIFVMPITISDRQFVFANTVTAKIYEMNSDTEGLSAKKGTVVTPSGNNNSDYKVVSVDYECVKAAIEKVEITGLKLPAHGEIPDDDCNVRTDGVYVSNAGGKVEWYCNGIKLNPATDKFEAGKTYKLSLWLRSDYVNGYRFKTDSNGDIVAEVLINGIPFEVCDTSEYDYTLIVEYDFYVPYNTITYINIVGIDYPVAGMVPDFDAVPTSTGYDIININWSDETLMSELIAAGSTYVEAYSQAKLTKENGKTFEAGHSYKVHIEVKPHDGYEIDYDYEEILDFAATVNGKDATEGSGYRGENAGFSCLIGTPELQLISNINITGVDAPVTGNIPDYDAVCGSDNYTIKGVFWLDKTLMAALKAEGLSHAEAFNKSRLVKGDGKTFLPGREYSVAFEIEPCKNFEINYDPADIDVLYYRATVNGQEAVESSDYRGANATFSYTFDKTLYRAVTDVVADGFDAPVAGNVADLVGSVAGTGVNFNDSYWFDVTEKKKLAQGEKFVAGHTYKFVVTVKAQESYRFALNASGYPDASKITVKINGNAATVENSGSGDTLSFSYSFSHTCEFKLVKKVDATCISKGKNAYYKCSCGKLSENTAGDKLIENIDIWGILPVNASNHSGGIANCTDKAKCTRCGQAYGSVDKNNHKSLITLKAVVATCTEEGKTEGKKCSTCGTITVKQETIAKKAHTLVTVKGKAATCTATGLTDGKKCSVCGTITVKQETIAKKAHTLVTVKGKAATCTATGLTDGKKCSVCGTVTVKQETIAKKAHSLVTVKGKAATCTATGLTDGKKCSVCGTVTVKQTTIAKKAHTYKNVTTKATLKKNGKVESKCSVCSNVKSTTVIYYPKTIKLSKTSYTYNGKEQKPSVTVKDSKGNTLKNGTDYTVKYSDGRKNTGKYTVTITFKGKYSGTKTLKYTIAPKATSKITVAQSTKAIKLTWSKVTGVTGYRVFQYDAKTKTWKNIKTLKATSFKVEKLKAGTEYKFRIKAYKTDEGTIWGAAKDITTATKPATSKITKLTAAKAKATLTWSNVDGENGYEVYASTKKDSGFKKVATTKANVAKATVSKLTNGKTWYFKVRSYKTVDGAKVYSGWSAVKSVKVK